MSTVTYMGRENETKCGTVAGYKGGCRCIGCTYAIRAYNRRYREANAKKVAEAAKSRDLDRLYGIDADALRALKLAQNWRCAICREQFPKEGEEGKRVHIDHCHRTDRVRGILCARCNSGIGKLGDTVEGLRRALDYLERFESESDK